MEGYNNTNQTNPDQGYTDQNYSDTNLVNQNNCNQNNQGGYNTNPGEAPGYGAAVASLVLGIIAVVLWFFGYSAIVSVVLGIIGLVCAGNAKKQGFVGGIRTDGFVLSLIGLIGGALVFVACVACVGALGVLGNSLY